MNHLGDTNKMVSDTPRTDSAVEYDDTTVDDTKEFARRLERELNAANAQVDRLTAKVSQLYEGAEEQKQRIKRLEEENNELRAEEARLLNTNGELERRIKRLVMAGDALENDNYTSDNLEAWNKSKEAKP